MEARELRIGNYIYHDGFEKSILEVNGIDLLGLVSFQGHGDYCLDKCQPIPLTKEWLLNLGFKQQYWNVFMLTYYKKGNILYSLSDGNVELNEPNICLTQLKHVHQLQNLYFALTGEELTLKN